MKHFVAVAACVLAVLLGGCASDSATRVAHDPYEPLNRGVYQFSDAVDRATFRPLAKGYRKFVPRLARSGVSNFFDNLVTPRSAVNNLLQGKPAAGGQDLFRFVVNSTMGIGGLINVASQAGMPEYNETFAQTLAVWGVPAGPYVFLPFLGPNTLSGVVAMPFDIAADPWQHYDESSVKDKLWALRIIDLRSRVLAAEGFLEDSEDPYIALREAYLQNREYRIYDGNPPLSEEEEDLFDEFLNED